MKTSALLAAGGSADLQAESAAPAGKGDPAKGPVIVSTWPFGKAANTAAMRRLTEGGSGLDAVEQGIHLPESDIQNTSVGRGGTPNAAGVVQLDACIMAGPGHRAGSVGALEGIEHPISVARSVMEKTRHVMLVGDGARRFALEQGFESVDLLSAAAKRRWEQRQTAPGAGAENHDTIAMLLLDGEGNMFGGCSTSGLAYKVPGRVGDSPIIGSGLYVDNEVGAAGATGVGENVMRYCGSFLVVEFMRQGMAPETACIATLERIAGMDPRGMDLDIHFIALDRQGRFGAAGTAQGFEYAVTTSQTNRLLKGTVLGSKVHAVGGNQPAK